MALNAMVLVAGDGSTVIVSCRVYQLGHALSAVCFLFLCARVFVPVDQDRAGAVVREVGQKQIQLDKDRTLQAKSPTELKTQQTAGSKQGQSNVCRAPVTISLHSPGRARSEFF